MSDSPVPRELQKDETRKGKAGPLPHGDSLGVPGLLTSASHTTGFPLVAALALPSPLPALSCPRL